MKHFMLLLILWGRYLYSQPFRGQILIFCPIVWFILIKFISLVVDHPSALWLLIW